MSQLTQREFLFLDDLLHMTELSVKEAADFSQHCTDPELQRLCTSVASRTERQFRTLFSHLNQAQGQGQSQSQGQGFGQSQFTQAQPMQFQQGTTSGYGFNQQ